jgi:uncharacterized protein involved in exopolysaccharide biosynthesis
MTGSNEILPELVTDGSVNDQGTSDLVARANLVVVSGKLTGRVFPLIRPETRVGRTADCPVRLDERAISSRHATIVQTPDGHSVVDHGSTNGTFLNGRRLQANEPFELSPGDSLQFAETVLTYLPPNASGGQEQTHYLSKLLPQVANSTALRLPDTGLPDAQLLVQLLKASQAPEEPEEPPVTLEQRIEQLKRVLAIVRRNWVPLFLCAAFGALLFDAMVFMNPPLSVAKTKLRVTPPANEKAPHYDRENDSFYTPLEQSFLSPKLVEQTLIAMGNPKPSKYRVDGSLRSLGFKQAAFATYEGSFGSTDPQYAVDFLTKHLETFLKVEISHAVHVAKTEVEFLDQRVKEREAELRKTEAELETFKGENMVGLPEFAGEHVSSREALYKRRAELSAAMSRASLELNAARKRLKEEDPVKTKRAEGAAPYEVALVDVKRRLGEARAKGFGDQHPEVIALMKQDEELQALANRARNAPVTATDRSTNIGIIDLKNRVTDADVAARSAGAELGEVNAQLKRLDGIVGKLPEVEAKFSELSRSYAVNQELHAQLFSQLRQKQLALDLERSSVMARYEVLVPPESAGVQLRRVLLTRALLGVGVGLVVGGLLVALLSLRRRLRQSKASAGTAIVIRSSQG